MTKPDLNDFAWFVHVVEEGGFAAAGRALDEPKSKLSRRIAQLEERLGVRLIQRTTRQFNVTEVGQTFYEHCKAMLVEAQAAPRPFEDSDLVMRVLADRGHRLFASPTLVQRMGNPSSPAELHHWPGLSLASGKHIHRWELFGPQGARAEVHFTPRLITTDMLALREAAVAGVGLVQLPVLMVKDQLAAGERVALLEGWEPRREVIHAVFPSRRGLLPSVRALVDFLTEEYARMVED